VVINCSAIPRDLIGSELFGYVEGAFTGARQGGSPGKFEFADTGTIFLDEIGDMPIDLQGHLLRVIEDRKVIRIGGNDAIPVDVRIIAATNRNIQKDIERGCFRQDLFYRLNVITIHMVPLRERMDDLEDLILLFYKKLTNNPNPPKNPFAESYIQALQNYDFPGNVRELQNIVERSMTIFPNGILDASHLPHEVLFSQKIQSEPTQEGQREYLADKETVYRLLLKNKGNVSKTAQEMGIARTTLYRKMDRYGLNKTVMW
jgi:transcriptional regulator with PAS, ATPase and Fis domain